MSKKRKKYLYNVYETHGGIYPFGGKGPNNLIFTEKNSFFLKKRDYRC